MDVLVIRELELVFYEQNIQEGLQVPNEKVVARHNPETDYVGGIEVVR